MINIGIGEKGANFLSGVWLPSLPSEEQEGGKRGTSALPALMTMSCTASSREFE